MKIFALNILTSFLHCTCFSLLYNSSLAVTSRNSLPRWGPAPTSTPWDEDVSFWPQKVSLSISRCFISVKNATRKWQDHANMWAPKIPYELWRWSVFVLLNGVRRTPGPRSRELQCLGLGIVSDKIPNVSVSSRSRRCASRVSSRPKRSRAHP